MVTKKHVLFVIENSTAPLDPRVWREALTLKKNGYEVSIICPQKFGQNKSCEVIEGIEIFRHPMPHEANEKIGFIFEYLNAIIWEFYLSLKIYLKKPFHFMHTANPPDYLFIIAFFYKLLKVKFIYDHHDISPESYVTKFERKDFLYYILLLFEKFSFKLSDIVISTNESYKNIAIERGKKNKRSVFVVRNGPDLSKIDFVSPNKNLKNGFKHLIAYVGAIGKQEGIENLLEIANIVVNKMKRNDIKFMIIGTGPHLNFVIELSKKMRLEKNVTFTGFIPYRQFYEILSTADICVNPEFKNEFTDKSTMLKIMDYMSFKKPIIQFETVEGKVTAGESAIYIKENNEKLFAEAIIELLNDKSKRKKMGDAGWSRLCQSMTWSLQQSKLIAAYNYMEKASIK